jgi:hypothetical protein
LFFFVSSTHHFPPPLSFSVLLLFPPQNSPKILKMITYFAHSLEHKTLLQNYEHHFLARNTSLRNSLFLTFINTATRLSSDFCIQPPHHTPP